MLLPHERDEAVNLLTQHTVNNYLYSNSSNLWTLLRNGFTGFASFTDKQLIAALSRLKDNNSSIKQFVDNIVDKILLGTNDG